MLEPPTQEQEIARGEVLIREWLSEEGVTQTIQAEFRALGTFTGLSLINSMALMDKELFSRSIVVALIVAYQLGREAMREETDNAK